PDDRQRPRRRRQPIHSVERVLQHRAIAEETAVLFGNPPTEATLDILLEPYALATRESQRPVEVNGIALDRSGRRGSQSRVIEKHRRRLMLEACRCMCEMCCSYTWRTRYFRRARGATATGSVRRRAVVRARACGPCFEHQTESGDRS